MSWCSYARPRSRAKWRSAARSRSVLQCNSNILSTQWVGIILIAFITFFVSEEVVHAATSSSTPPHFVIGAGFGRSGTDSLKLALNRLGYKTYHMTEVTTNQGLWGAMYTASEAGESEDSIAALELHAVDTVIEQGYTATADFPACTAYKSFLKRIPNGKVILTQRSSHEVWADSFLDTIARYLKVSAKFPFSLLPNLYACQAYSLKGVGLRIDNRHEFNKKQVADASAAWAAEVKRTVAPENLLVLVTGSVNYTHVCKFLEIPLSSCPVTEPWPHSIFTRRYAIHTALAVFSFIVDYPVCCIGSAIGFLLLMVFLILKTVRACAKRCVPKHGNNSHAHSKKKHT
eukprot:m.113805 g.113805  ORF g.113805 m.113805 type:complete len:345 (-) comp28295_c0_seq1:174-1208(-)